jgi:HK97 family phage major capsid protein
VATNSHANDAMIRRLEKELEERNSAAQAIIANAQGAERDLNDPEKETLAGLRDRMTELRGQLTELESTAEIATQVGARLKQIDQTISTARRTGSKVVEYRSAGEYMVEAIAAHNGSRQAQERLEVFHREADHQLTGDNLGVIPDPIVGNVINFIDAARPLVSAIGPMSLPSNTFYRPKVTQHTAVGRQTDGATAEVVEKVELESQKMLITRLTVNSDTYGGYVNVSRQNIDFSSPQIMDLIVNDLAAQYAIATEEATADTLATTSATAVEYPLNPTADELATAIWSAVGTVYSATKGAGRLVLAVASDRLGAFGPLFAPVNPQSAHSTGMLAGSFGQGVLGTISGIPVVMSAGLDSGEAFLFSTAAVEVFEQRVGTLQVVEPSVLGVQVAYAGYFATLKIENNGIVPLEEGTA